MPSTDLVFPADMSRVAVVAPRTLVREALVELARAGCVELDGDLPPAEGEAAAALRRLADPGGADEATPALVASQPDVPALERAAKRGLLAGEVELKRRARLAVDHGSFSAWLGWAPTGQIEQLNAGLAEVGSAVELPRPPRVEPPTLFRPVAVDRPFRPLVESYGTARYRDVDPTRFSAATFVVMFGMMFGDVGHGLLLALLGLLLRQSRRGRLAAFRPLWPIPFIAGLVAAGFGFLYGEAFGPTGLVPTLWLNPLEEPVTLLLAGLVVGAVLLTVSSLIGIVNRWRGSGFREALVAQSGIAGLMIFAGGGILVGGFYWGRIAIEILGGVIAGTGLTLLGLGVVRAGGGVGALSRAGVELVNGVIRLASNLISFTRLGAFGLMHAALGAVVLYAASALWGGVVGIVAAAAVFVLGNLVAFALEVLVTGVQALRLEYYELYSRIFSGEGRAFAPWSMRVLSSKEES